MESRGTIFPGNKAAVAVAMSGGVDSSVAAFLLKEQGFRVIGVTMLLYPHPDYDYAANTIEAARKVANALEIPHHVIDLQNSFKEKVISYFCQEYVNGRTPNPCVVCNRYIKFGALMEQAQLLGADYLATGHHARIEREAGGRYLLKKGADVNKDQSYFLYRLLQEQLSRSIFPIGSYTKEQVRRVARENRIPVSSRESQEICFVPDGDYTRIVMEHTAQAEPGPVLDLQGKVLGEHRGIPYYTIGQRRGLGIAASEPLFVIAIDAGRNEITVGSKRDTYACEFTVSGLNWLAGETPSSPMRANVKIRYRHSEADALLEPRDGKIRVALTEPQMAITPGQSAVFYNGDTVLGGGTIDKVYRTEACHA